MVPWSQPFDRHAEGNSAAHVKTSLGGSIVLISGGKLIFGTWQGIWFCEFDGPRFNRPSCWRQQEEANQATTGRTVTARRGPS